MSYGKPALATRAGGIVEFMQSGKTGFLFKVGDVDGFAKKLLELSHSLDVVKKLGENAKNVAEQGFSGEKIVGKYINYYQKIINKCK
jgi:glycosyltransferase involved in cell wall biosynthesis